MNLEMSLTTSLKALADERRMKILRMLLSSDLCVGALARHLGVSKPAVSQHLRILRKAALVKGEKRGYWTHYVVDREALARIAQELNQMATEDPPHGTTCWRISETPVESHQPEEIDQCDHCCQQPDKLADKPQNCGPEQIRECHGEAKENPCPKENSVPRYK